MDSPRGVSPTSPTMTSVNDKEPKNNGLTKDQKWGISFVIVGVALVALGVTALALQSRASLPDQLYGWSAEATRTYRTAISSMAIVFGTGSIAVGAYVIYANRRKEYAIDETILIEGHNRAFNNASAAAMQKGQNAPSGAPTSTVSGSPTQP